ncbi:hypothetical protein [Flavobacterium sp. J27]|uniref:hypothetical protein n=1 Tax=Flavobacterium sp. J27 TaxID=2060419 RepID=UPI0010312E78|nr:hypothetical protein [Flavobacterium sp. J27]
MKYFPFVLLFFFKVALSQENKILNLLNDQLLSEIMNYEHEDSLTVIQPFHIDTAKKLSFKVAKYNPNLNQKEIITSEVALNEIIGFIKDINVIFSTENNMVIKKVQVYNEREELIDTYQEHSNLFFTEICKEQHNSDLQAKMLKAFKKAGYTITSEYWFD